MLRVLKDVVIIPHKSALSRIWLWGIKLEAFVWLTLKTIFFVDGRVT